METISGEVNRYPEIVTVRQLAGVCFHRRAILLLRDHRQYLPLLSESETLYITSIDYPPGQLFGVIQTQIVLLTQHLKKRC